LVIRAYYWKPATRRVLLRKPHFRVGNAGDLFVEDLLRWAYPTEKLRLAESGGSRLLAVGSIAHRALPGDVLAGVGVKGSELPTHWPVGAEVIGARGPRSLEALERAGADISGVRWLGDPGLLVGQVFPDLVDILPRSGQIGVIPHFRERGLIGNLREEAKFIDIDDTAYNVARAIAECEVVYSSSLHGIIWAHALGRPVLPVVPLTPESPFKYHDYFESIGAEYSPAPDFGVALRSEPPASLDVRGVIRAIEMPSADELRTRGVIR